MRKSQLTRKKPWRPKPCELKRKKPINRESKKHRQQRSRISKEDSPREQYRKLHPQCQLCSKRRATDVHEVVRRSTHGESVEHRCCWLSLCRRCHRRCEDYTDMPISRQCYLKKIRDPQGYDLAAINRLRGRGPEAITEAEVDQWDRVPWSVKGSDYAPR